MIICEGLHLRWNGEGVRVWVAVRCGQEEHPSHDQIPATQWVGGGCRHEHVQVLPLCDPCRETVTDREVICEQCIDLPEPEAHHCLVTPRVTRSIRSRNRSWIKRR